MSLYSIHVENYRGFVAPTELIIRPVTILIGRNSSGKSSLLRLVPLIQQSLEKTGSVPILWESDLVDMGSIADVISRGDASEGVTIGFTVLISDIAEMMDPLYEGKIDKNKPPVKIVYKAHLANIDGKTAFDSFRIEMHGLTLVVKWDSAGRVTSIICDNCEIDISKYEFKIRSNDLFPVIARMPGEEELNVRRKRISFFPPLREELKEIFHRRTSEAKIDSMMRRVWFQDRDAFAESLSNLPHVVKKRITGDLITKLHRLTFIHEVTDVLAVLETEITACFEGSAYIGPARARAERFNRIQELAVDRITSGGDNTAMYINYLNEAQKASFNHLMKLASGHVVSVEPSGPSHISMRVGREDDAYSENVNDIGFGFSQIIPVVAQIHAVIERPARNGFFGSTEVLYAVEQPELHLHPAMQGQLADLFVYAAQIERDDNHSIKIIAETHSENIIARLGRLIASGKISEDSVSIVYVEKDEKTGYSSLRSISYDEDGNIPEWPLGFFSG